MVLKAEHALVELPSLVATTIDASSQHRSLVYVREGQATKWGV